jgi:hypothetical protein
LKKDGKAIHGKVRAQDWMEKRSFRKFFGLPDPKKRKGPGTHQKFDTFFLSFKCHVPGCTFSSDCITQTMQHEGIHQQSLELNEDGTCPYEDCPMKGEFVPEAGRHYVQHHAVAPFVCDQPECCFRACEPDKLYSRHVVKHAKSEEARKALKARWELLYKKQAKKNEPLGTKHAEWARDDKEWHEQNGHEYDLFNHDKGRYKPRTRVVREQQTNAATSAQDKESAGAAAAAGSDEDDEPPAPRSKKARRTPKAAPAVVAPQDEDEEQPRPKRAKRTPKAAPAVVAPQDEPETEKEEELDDAVNELGMAFDL